MRLPATSNKPGLADYFIVPEKVGYQKRGKTSNDNLRTDNEYPEFVGHHILHNMAQVNSGVNNGDGYHKYHDTIKQDAFIEIVYKKIKHGPTGNGQQYGSENNGSNIYGIEFVKPHNASVGYRKNKIAYSSYNAGKKACQYRS